MWKLTAIALSEKHAENGLNTLKTMILIGEMMASRRTKIALWCGFGRLCDDPCQRQEELRESLGVHRTTGANRLKALGMIQKQANWVPLK